VGARTPSIRACYLRPSLLQPSLGFSVADEPEQPSEESETVTATEPELRCMRSEGLCELTGVVVSTSDGVDDDAGDGLRVLVIEEKI
jgi:hypothetical protein